MNKIFILLLIVLMNCVSHTLFCMEEETEKSKKKHFLKDFLENEDIITSANVLCNGIEKRPITKDDIEDSSIREDATLTRIIKTELILMQTSETSKRQNNAQHSIKEGTPAVDTDDIYKMCFIKLALNINDIINKYANTFNFADEGGNIQQYTSKDGLSVDDYTKNMGNIQSPLVACNANSCSLTFCSIYGIKCKRLPIKNRILGIAGAQKKIIASFLNEIEESRFETYKASQDVTIEPGRKLLFQKIQKSKISLYKTGIVITGTAAYLFYSLFNKKTCNIPALGIISAYILLCTSCSMYQSRKATHRLNTEYSDQNNKSLTFVTQHCYIKDVGNYFDIGCEDKENSFTIDIKQPKLSLWQKITAFLFW